MRHGVPRGLEHRRYPRGDRTSTAGSSRTCASWSSSSRSWRARSLHRERSELLAAKRLGYSDTQIALAVVHDAAGDREALRQEHGLEARVQARRHLRGRVRGRHALPTTRPTRTRRAGVSTEARKVMILGGGPNRIGQGIEFDYCCCHAAFAVKEAGSRPSWSTANPETVSTDYDTSDELYFEPLTHEDVMHIVRAVEPRGDHRAVRRADPAEAGGGLDAAGAPCSAPRPTSIDRAEDRERFAKLLQKLGLRAAGQRRWPGRSAEAFEIAPRIGYPVLVRPSYVLGGRAMEIVYDDESLDRYMTDAVRGVARPPGPGRQVPRGRDRGRRRRHRRTAIDVVVGAGSWSTSRRPGSTRATRPACSRRSHARPGDPDRRDPPGHEGVHGPKELGVVGLMNVQYARQGHRGLRHRGQPARSRTVPFVSKAIGVPLAKLAAKVMAPARPSTSWAFTEEASEHPTSA